MATGHFKLFDDISAVARMVFDPSGNVNFGDASPSGRFDVSGTTIADADGVVADARVVPDSCDPTEGSVTLSLQQTATVNTVSGRKPIVCVEALGPALISINDGFGGCLKNQGTGAVSILELNDGNFKLKNMDFCDCILENCASWSRTADYTFM